MGRRIYLTATGSLANTPHEHLYDFQRFSPYFCRATHGTARPYRPCSENQWQWFLLAMSLPTSPVRVSLSLKWALLAKTYPHAYLNRTVIL